MRLFFSVALALLLTADLYAQKVVTVAAFDSSAEARENADVVCDGENDEQTIQKVLDSFDGTGDAGCSIRFYDGTYNIGAFYEAGDFMTPTAIRIGKISSLEFVGMSTCMVRGGAGPKFRVLASAYDGTDPSVQLSVIACSDRNPLNTNHVTLKNFRIELPDMKHKVVCVNTFKAGGAILENIWIDADGFGPGKMPVEGSVGVRGTSTNPNGIGQHWKDVVVRGFYEGFQVGGEHLVAVECLARNCYYGYTFGNYDIYETARKFNQYGVWEHPNTLINCAEELCAALPLFNVCGSSRKPNSRGFQVVDLISHCIEYRPKENPTLEPVIPAMEVVPGTWCGNISFAGNRYAESMENAVDVHFWAEGSGQRFITRNSAHAASGTSEERETYAPMYMQQYFDTDLNRLLVFNGKKWVDASGNDVCRPSVKPEKPVYLDMDADIEDRVEDALSRMTVEEKIGVIHAQSKFSARGVPRLGIPDIWMNDGPAGVREESLWDKWDGAGWTNDSCTAHPALTCMAATWSREVASLYGKSIGEEARYRNKTVILAPGVNIFRTPLCGRNFEYLGEDPFLAGEICVPYIKSIQESKVGACVKHFALNNQEAHRHAVNVKVDDRALYEIYLPAFKAAVHEAGSWSIMGAYNRYDGEYCCHNDRLLNGILKGEWAYDGVVVSDWGGTMDTEQAIKNGLDMEFGTGTDGLRSYSSNSYDNFHLASPYLQMIRQGTIGTSELDDKVRRVLRLVFRTSMAPDRPWGSFATEEHYAIARRVAEEGIVLLRNEDRILPLKFGKKRPRILIVGDNAKAKHASGGGSSYLKTTHETTPYEGIVKAVGNKADVAYVCGYKPFTGEEPSFVRELREEAVAAAEDADIVLFFGGLNKWGHQDCEGLDRQTYGLPFAQDRLIEELADANRNIVVSLTTGTAVAMPWKDKVKAILYNWYLGSEGGTALAGVLTGDICPSGKMPFTIAERLSDYAPHALSAYDADNSAEVEYKEGIFVGYRWFDENNIEPLFPFGYGLSYTSFRLGEAKADREVIVSRSKEVSPDIVSEREAGPGDSIVFRIPVTNTGKVKGAEVVQLYIRDVESSLPRPDRELKAFEKVWLEPGETKVVELTIHEEDLRFFDDKKHCWVSETGFFEVLIGTSSRDMDSVLAFELK